MIKSKVPQLTEKNYMTWKMKMMAVLSALGLASYLGFEYVKADSDTDTDEDAQGGVSDSNHVNVKRERNWQKISEPPDFESYWMNCTEELEKTVEVLADDLDALLLKEYNEKPQEEKGDEPPKKIERYWRDWKHPDPQTPSNVRYKDMLRT